MSEGIVNARVDSFESEAADGVSRRSVLKWGAVGTLGAGVAAAQGFGAPLLAQKGLLSPDGAFGATSTAIGDLVLYTEVFPTSPLIMSPFSDALPIPPVAKPVPVSEFSGWKRPPGPGLGQQNSVGNTDSGSHGTADGNETHQQWPTGKLVGQTQDPLVYKIDVKIAQHSFTTSQVMPINSSGKPTVSFDASNVDVWGDADTFEVTRERVVQYAEATNDPIAPLG